jgi:hypothetical protein
MWKYMKAHWYGEQNIWQLCILNGFLAFITGSLVTGFFVKAAQRFGLFNFFYSYVNDSTAACVSVILVFIALALPWILLMTWTVVGVFQCGCKRLAAEPVTTSNVVQASIAILSLLAWLVIIQRAAATLVEHPPSIPI